MQHVSSLHSWLFRSLFLAILFSTSQLIAQTSLFNIPTSEVAERGSFYLEADLDAHLERYRDDGWQSYGLFGVYGVRKNLEIGLNGYVTRTANGIEPIELQPNLKFRAYNNESRGISISTGAVAYIPLSRRAATGATASAYVVAGKKFKSSWAPRLFGGIYQLIGAKANSGSRRGFLFGIEQPLTRRVGIIADWNTGKNRFGYAAAGIGIALTKRSFLYSAYYVGNTGWRNNSVGIYYGRYF